MALIPIFHVVAAERSVATGQNIKMGQCVSLDSDGEVVIQDNATNTITYGLAGDTKSTSKAYMPGIVSGWQNRVSDYFDETKASGKMTVYHSGGEFATDMFSANVTSSTAPMVALYASNGLLDTANTVNYEVARLVKAAATYPSGVPGIDLNGDMALTGDDATGSGGTTYIEIKLTI